MTGAERIDERRRAAAWLLADVLAGEDDARDLVLDLVNDGRELPQIAAALELSIAQTEEILDALLEPRSWVVAAKKLAVRGGDVKFLTRGQFHVERLQLNQGTDHGKRG